MRNVAFGHMNPLAATCTPLRQLPLRPIAHTKLVMSFSIAELQAYFRELGVAGLHSLYKTAAFQRFEDTLATQPTSDVALQHACNAVTALASHLDDQLFLLNKARAFLLSKLADAQG